PTIDGVISPGEWDVKGQKVFHRMYSVDSKIETYMMWDYSYLYLAASVSDWSLWDETNIYPWIVFNDDSLEVTLDMLDNGGASMAPGDFLFQAEPGGNVLLSEATDTDFSGIPDTDFFARTSYAGTLNDNSDIDSGFVVEAAIPWTTLKTTPYDGMPMGACFWRYSDDDGGDYMVDTEAITTFYSPNDWITNRGGESGSNRNPSTWATVVLSDSYDVWTPSQIADLSVTVEHAYSALLHFSAADDNGWYGRASEYRIRYTSDPSASIEAFNDYTTIYRPNAYGEQESLRMAGLDASTTYRVCLSAVDEHGNEGQCSNIAQFTTPAAPQDTKDRGYVVQSPNGRYLMTMDGSPFTPIGCGMPFGLFFWAFEPFQEMTVEEFFQKLEDNGVNTLRVFAEDYYPDEETGEPDKPLEPSLGVFDEEVLAKLTTILDLCREHGIYLVLSPWDNFYYVYHEGAAGPYAGVISSVRDEFYGNPDVRPYQRARIKKLYDTLGTHTNLMMWELVNEYDNPHWNNEQESVRQSWIKEMAEYLRSLGAVQIIAPSFNSPSPQGWEGRGEFVYNYPEWGVTTFHLYYPSIADPNKYYSLSGRNPFELASGMDKGFLPAQRTSQALKFAYGQIAVPRPVFHTETATIEASTGLRYYDSTFTQQDDERMFNAMNWAHLAGGGAGTGLRYTALTETSLLTDKMYEFYGLYSAFCAENVDWVNFNPKNITEDLVISGLDQRNTVRSAISDGKTCIIYLTRDLSIDPSAVNNSSIEIPGLVPAAKYTAEFWDAGDSSARTPMSTTSVSACCNGKCIITLPTWTTGIAIKLYKTGDCVCFAGDLSLDLPCVSYAGIPYAFTLYYYYNIYDPYNLYWVMDLTSFTAGSNTGDCLAFGSDLSIQLPCAGYDCERYGFTLNYYYNPYDPYNLYWIMDLASFTVE
ncbi:MAG: cellulase family glycosylhydrolase, partial [Thermodesulfobacteriota bacterium]|nr:cellulase family glycosylhydrolase [Thermodesulfobacteriota bacterium]